MLETALRRKGTPCCSVSNRAISAGPLLGCWPRALRISADLLRVVPFFATMDRVLSTRWLYTLRAYSSLRHYGTIRAGWAIHTPRPGVAKRGRATGNAHS